MASIESQCIDSRGKCLVINYQYISVLIWPPISPLNDITRSNEIKRCSLNEAQKFCVENSYEIISQNIVQKITSGLFFKRPSDNRFYYIPINNIPTLKNIPKSNVSIPSSKNISQLENIKRIIQVANHLKSYSVFEWFFDTVNFNKSVYTVIKNYEYSLDHLHGKLIRYTPIMYKEKKLIVPSKRIIPRLVNYVEIYTKKFANTITNLVTTGYIHGYMENIDDYQPRNSSIIFSSKKDITIWMLDTLKTSNKISHNLESKLCTKPYLYSNTYIHNGNLCIIQNNINGDLQTALVIGMYWKKYKINLGYACNIDAYKNKHIPYNLYSVKGLIDDTHTRDISKNKYKKIVDIITFEDVFSTIILL